MASTWVLGWSSTCNEVIYPRELPVGLSKLLLCGPRSLSTAHWQPGVEPPRTCSPSSPMQAPSERSSMPWSSSLVPMNRRGAQHASVVRPPFTFSRIVQPGFEFSPRARAGPRAAVVEDEGLSFLTCWSCSACCHTPPRSSPGGPWPPLLAHVQINVPGPPTFSCCARRQSEWSHCRPRSSLLTWHPSASTADSLLSPDYFFILLVPHVSSFSTWFHRFCLIYLVPSISAFIDLVPPCPSIIFLVQPSYFYIYIYLIPLGSAFINLVPRVLQLYTWFCPVISISAWFLLVFPLSTCFHLDLSLST